MTQTKHPEYQYLDLIRELLEKGIKQTDRGTGVVTYSLFGRHMRYDLSEGFPLLTTKRVYWKGVLHELCWFLEGQTNIKYLVDNNVHIWDDYPYRIYRERMERGDIPQLTKEAFIEKIAADKIFAKTYGDLAHCYGEMWRRWPASDGRSVDQLAWVIEELRRDPDCHNAVVSAWNPEFLYDMAPPGKALRFPICHSMFQFNIKNRKLNCQLYQRSADIFLGVPFNIASYALLTTLIARATGNEPGEFIHTFGDVHIYENHTEPAKEQLSREPRPFPKLEIDAQVTTINDFRPEHALLTNYDPHPTIKAQLSPIGGAITESWKTYLKEIDG